jgi:thiamine kinase-like enzyme
VSSEIEQARTALAAIPALSATAAHAKITRLGGLTNLVFKVEAGGALYCLRLPGRGTEAYIDRKIEAANARAAAKGGVSPEVAHFGGDGVMLTRFVDGAVTMSPALFKERDGAVERAARAFRALHDNAPAFAFRFELFSMIDNYLGVLEKLGAELPDGYHDAVAEAAAVREALAAHPAALKPCHCDPLSENFLDTGTRMWIVDWEYSGMNDPMWDLGDLSVEAGFDDAQDKRLIEAYFGAPASAFDLGRMVIYKAMCDLLWTLWGLIQHANKNPAEDFWAYSLNRFARCRKLMRSDEFPRHLEAARRG